MDELVMRRAVTTAACGVLVLGLLVAGTRSAGDPRLTTARLAPATEGPEPGAPSEQPSDQPSGQPSGEPGEPAAPPSPTPAPETPARDETGAPGPKSPTPSPSEDDWTGWDQPDGRPGYSTGFGGCSQGELPKDSEAPAPGLRLELHTILGEARPGADVYALASVTNTSDQRATFDLTSSAGDQIGLLLDGQGRPRSAMRWSDAIGMRKMDLAAGESTAFAVSAQSVVCGDTSADPETPLPAGTYQFVAVAGWHTDRDYGDWLSDPLPVRLTPEAQEPPCAEDETECRGEPWYFGAGWTAKCTTEQRTGGDYGDGRDLRLQVDVTDVTVPAGEPVKAEAVVSNDGDVPHWFLAADPVGHGLLRSAGGPMGDGPGPAGRGDYVIGGRVPPARNEPGKAYRVDPGGSVRVPVEIASTNCAGDPLPEGRYRVATGVYVTHWGWWVAPEADVTLTS